jgi:ribosomal protein S18 acetylase RimI-like enzyme
MNPFYITINQSSEAEIETHLRDCDERFRPKLSARINIQQYSAKIANKADRVELRLSQKMVGLVAVYLNNNDSKTGFISSVSICSEYEGLGLAAKLLNSSIQHANEKHFKTLVLDVSETNKRAISFYLKYGFHISQKNNQVLTMSLNLLEYQPNHG